jgi:hypothetical protein
MKPWESRGAPRLLDDDEEKAVEKGLGVAFAGLGRKGATVGRGAREKA